MRNLIKHLSSLSTPFHLPSLRFKSSKTRPSRKTSASKNASLKEPSPPSLYQTITEIVGVKDQANDDYSSSVSLPREDRDVLPRCTPPACQIAQESKSISDAKQPRFQKAVSEQTHVGSCHPVDVSPIVQKVTEIVRAENRGICMEHRLNKLGLSFSSEIVENVLKRCFKVGHLALRFFNWVKLQPDFCHTTQTYNTMIYIAGEAENFDLVEKLMEEMDDELCSKDIKTWTIVISHYGKAGHVGKTLRTFDLMKKSGCELDSRVYKTILRALCNARKSELAMEFYKEMVSKNMPVDVHQYQMLMSCLVRSDDTESIRLVRDDMIEIAMVSESKAYMQTLKSFCSSGNIKEALQVFEEMKKKNILVDTEAYEIVLRGFCRAGRMIDAKEFVDSMKNNSSVDIKDYGFLIDGFLREGDFTKALELLHDMKESGCLPMLSSYTQIMQHLFRSDQYRKACELYEDMIKSGIEPDIVAITAVVAGHVRHGHISEAWSVFEGMKKKGLRPTWKAYTVFIKELCKASKPREALKLLKEMSHSNLNATDEIFRLVITSLNRNCDLEKVKEVEKIMRLFKVDSLENEQIHQEIDHISDEDHKVSSPSFPEDINTIQTTNGFKEKDLKGISRTLSSSNDWRSKQEDLERSMIHFTPEIVEAILKNCQRHSRAALIFFSWIGKQPGYKHTAETYNMAIKLAGSAKDFKHMRHLYQEMRRKDCPVTSNTWTIIIAQYGQAGLTELALKTFKEMKSEGYQPNGSTYKYMIVFLCGKKGRKIDDAIKIFQEMSHAGYMPDREMVEVYLSSLCELGKIEEARRSVISLCKRGFTTQLGFSLLIKSLCRARRIEEALTLVNEIDKIGCTLDQYIYGSIVHALLRGGHLEEALNKLEEMKNVGLPQTTHIQTALIVHFCREKEIGKAVEIFKNMRENGCEPTVVTYSALIRGYMNMGMISDAWSIFQRMKLKGPYPDFETYSMFMTCLCKAGRSEDGLQLLHEMLDSEIIPSAINFRTVFCGLNREGKHDLAHSVLQTKWLLKRERMFLS
ncbi:putative pentatricopeptide repeat-containing protein At5g06400, mitochondrial [Typha latifolia]|uniref:putative pentatricopeptide repeat-containing protein At5g06400, mitochondrial n=1 Tax=Typha latifolia TaxID=4733 RepID=UPI003C2D7902